jgi:flagellar biosynthesis chaperone FliJ
MIDDHLLQLNAELGKLNKEKEKINNLLTKDAIGRKMNPNAKPSIDVNEKVYLNNALTTLDEEISQIKMTIENNINKKSDMTLDLILGELNDTKQKIIENNASIEETRKNIKDLNNTNS